MNTLEPLSPLRASFPKTAEAIADAANADPLDGSPVRTASILLGLGWYESRFKTDAVDKTGHTFGLFQIDPTARSGLSRVMLVDPRQAAPIAIELIRVSERVCARYPEDERLGHYASGGNGCAPAGRRVSRYRTFLARKIERLYPLKNEVARDSG